VILWPAVACGVGLRLNRGDPGLVREAHIAPVEDAHPRAQDRRPARPGAQEAALGGAVVGEYRPLALVSACGSVQM
jgi:hypothetical protein